MNKAQEIIEELDALEEAGKIELSVDGEFWTGSGLSDEAPNAKQYSGESKALKDGAMLKKKYPKAKIEITRNAGMNNETTELIEGSIDKKAFEKIIALARKNGISRAAKRGVDLQELIKILPDDIRMDATDDRYIELELIRKK